MEQKLTPHPPDRLNPEDAMQIARQAIANICARFPGLQVNEDALAPIELSVAIPQQPGVQRALWLGLQNRDELHFSVGHFWAAWFPCTDPARVRAYTDAVCGYLGGQYRVLEHYRGRTCVKAELQAPRDSSWQTISTWSRPWLPIPWRKHLRELRNA